MINNCSLILQLHLILIILIIINLSLMYCTYKLIIRLSDFLNNYDIKVQIIKPHSKLDPRD